MAFSNSYSMNVDLKRRITSVVPTFKQGDNGVLRFKIYDDGKLYDLSNYTYSEITFRLPSGEVLVGNPVLEDDELVYNFTKVEMSEVGKVETVLSIMSGITMVSVQPFNCFIFDSMKNENLSYIGILQDLIKEVQDLGLSIEGLLHQLNDTLDLTQEKMDELSNLLLATQLAENTRESNEQIRIDNENQRVISENDRINSENNRTINEQLRLDNESQRVSNELLREQTHQEMNSLVDGLKSFEYSPSTTYDFPNLVTYNGSTYIALQQVTNIVPNNDQVNWRLVAQRGVDGNGAVSSVNGILPDLNGNVEIKIADNTIIESSTEPVDQDIGGIWFDTSEGVAETIIYTSENPPTDTNLAWFNSQPLGGNS